MISVDANLMPQRGLTLVEMLIALVLSSIIFVSAYQVISNLIQYQVHARTLYDRQTDKALTINMLSQIIEKSLLQSELYFNPQDKTLFRGEAESIQLVSRAFSDRFDKPGFRVYRLFHRDGELYVQYRAYDENYLSNRKVVMPTGLKIEEIRFEYFDKGHWSNSWNDRRSIPPFVRVQVDFPGAESAEWVRGTGRS